MDIESFTEGMIRVLQGYAQVKTGGYSLLAVSRAEEHRIFCQNTLGMRVFFTRDDGSVVFVRHFKA